MIGIIIGLGIVIVAFGLFIYVFLRLLIPCLASIIS